MVVPCWHFNLVLHLHFNNKQLQLQLFSSLVLAHVYNFINFIHILCHLVLYWANKPY